MFSAPAALRRNSVSVGAGNQGVHANALLGVVERRCLDQADQPALARRIGKALLLGGYLDIV